jgi:CheY-like chemotaxis protein
MQDPNPIDVNAVIASTLDLLRRALGDTIALETAIADDLWRIAIDGPGLEIALLGLAVNARDAMSKGGTLRLEAANLHLDAASAGLHGDVTPGDYVLVSVGDTGAGLIKQVVDKGFTPYFTAKEISHGTGLGLVEVHAFVKQSGGHVKILSEPGTGTTVRLYFPRRDATGTAEAPRPGIIEIGSGALILLVEDDIDVRAVTSQTLAGLGYTVVVAAGTREALKIASQRWDLRLLLTDVGLRGKLDGRQLADAVHVLHPGLPVLFTSGYPKDVLVGHGRLERGVELLTKPFTGAQLGAKLAEMLR